MRDTIRESTPSPSAPATSASPPTSADAATDAATTLRQEIVDLGEMLGVTIKDIASPASLDIVETVRQLSRDGRRGDHAAEQRLRHMLTSLDEEQLRVIIRAFSVFLDLANVAEDRQRVRVLRDRARKIYPRPRAESVEDALLQLKAAGSDAADVQQLLDRLHVELVFTAHPTEAKRRSVRRKLRRIRELLNASAGDLLPSELEHNRTLLRGELAKLWLTDLFRPWRPTVLQEVQRGLSFIPVLWEVVPQILGEVREALAKVYPDHDFQVRPIVSFGSWIGGDRDGHPHVTADITEQTLVWLRQAALDLHVTACRALFASLTLSESHMPMESEIVEAITETIDRWPPLRKELGEIPPNELCRRWLAVIEWRLKRTREIGLEGLLIDGAYESSEALEADVAMLCEALLAAPSGALLADDLILWLDRIRVFGFHVARLDVRQDARPYMAVMNELLAGAGVVDDPANLSEAQRLELLTRTIAKPLKLQGEPLSVEARETLALFRLLRRTVRAFGPQALGGHVVSMTCSSVDILTVLWLWRHADMDQETVSAEPHAPLPLIPLFETIEDLQQAPVILGSLLSIPAYRDHLRRQQNRQIVMLGYSDSTKDGGYLSACWSLYRCQQQLQAVAARAGVELTFFHGRGGSLGRGGGPAARSILSLPPGTFHGSLRITEQGEVLADRYDDPNIAHRHLEQVLWSSMLSTGLPAAKIPEAWNQTMQQLADESFRSYRELVEQPGFVDYFRRATPISEIERLPIGSRPSRRRAGHSLSDLRAIPWVFSWTQARCLVPAWYGMGTAVEMALADPKALELMQTMYRQWPFFRATLDNAELALAKTSLRITECYASLTHDSQDLTAIGKRIAAEFARAKQAVMAITGSTGLLAGTPWLHDSIRVRNWYIDPLNLIQVELLRRLRAAPQDRAVGDEEALRQLMRLTINGLAAGMRTSG